MGYAEGGYSGSGLKIGAIVATMILGTFVVPPIKRYFNDQKDMTELASTEGVDRQLAADPMVSGLVRIVQQRFPGDYAALNTAIRTAAQARDMKAIGSAVENQLGVIFQRDGGKAASAPAPQLMNIAATELNLLNSLSISNCAAFVKSAPLDGVPPPERAPLLTKMAVARLLAIAEGRDHPVSRQPVDAALAGEFQTALNQRGVSYLVQEMFTGKRSIEQATDETICEAQKQMLATVQSMPSDDGARYFAGVL